MSKYKSFLNKEEYLAYFRKANKDYYYRRKAKLSSEEKEQRKVHKRKVQLLWRRGKNIKTRRVTKKDARSKALSLGYKSMFEVKVHEQLNRMIGKKVLYEPDRINFVQPEKKRYYVPDFKIKGTQNEYIEAKGRFTMQDRQKHLWIKEQYPDMKVYFVFANPWLPINKGSKTTYAVWCEKNGFEWASIEIGIPKHWLK